MHLFKGIRDTFENFVWNFRDIGIQRFLDFVDAFSEYYMVLGILGTPFQGLMVLYYFRSDFLLKCSNSNCDDC